MPSTFKELRPLIKHLLLRHWDPIGVAEHTEAQGEYDSYVPAIYRLLTAGISEQGLAEHLKHVELAEMATSGSDEARQRTASALVALVDPTQPPAHAFPCPACGFLTFDEPPGSYSICEVCGWEDDAVQLRHPALRGGANKLSLAEAQQDWRSRRPKDVGAIKGFDRDPAWRPLLADESERARASLGPGGTLPAVDATGTNEVLYYWLVPRQRAG